MTESFRNEQLEQLDLPNMQTHAELANVIFE